MNNSILFKQLKRFLWMLLASTTFFACTNQQVEETTAGAQFELMSEEHTQIGFKNDIKN
ncbi:MAG TPA: hypothetical protein PLY70_16765 [Saprospiraceae bacterium]|nr:hypothetical protein [Saprospiraceae bacterium]